jgi:hypothetical protein
MIDNGTGCDLQLAAKIIFDVVTQSQRQASPFSREIIWPQLANPSMVGG